VQRRRIWISDTTLRAGDESPGVALLPLAKAEIAGQLERLGVDVVETGAATTRAEVDGVRAVAARLTRPTVAVLARGLREEVDAAADALAGAARSRVHVVLPAAEGGDVVAAARELVGRAAARADEVAFSCEDATRADRALVAEVCRAAILAGASVVGLPDTSGRTLPDDYSRLLADVQERCLPLRDVVLSVHCRDDLGLAVASSLAGVRAGAAQVECAVNGIGARAGDASLEEVVVALAVRGDHYGALTEVDTTQLAAVSRLVAARTGYVVQPNKAVVGANAFAHEAGIHQDGMLKDERTYQIIDPAAVGVRMTLPLGKHSGRHAFARACAELGLELEGAGLDEAFRRFKERADAGGAVPLDDFYEEVGT